MGKGYGELRLLERIDAALCARQPDVTTTWCGLTAEFHAGAASLRPGQPVVPLPFDALPSVARWVANVRPDVVVFVERFWYPVLAGGAATAGARLVAANAIGWHHPSGSGLGGALEARSRRRIAARFAALGFQSERQAEHARPYLAGAVPTTVTGNVKLDLPPLSPDPARDAAIAAWLGGAEGCPLLAAASTRKGDEPFVLEAFTAVRRERPCALLLAPREMHRVPLVEDLLRKAGWVASRRSAPVGRADVFLLDTVGELGAALAHARAAFVGGTLRHLGQNFVEPLQHGLHVAFGRAQVLLMDEQRACADAGLGTWVDTPADLAAHWLAALDDEESMAMRRARAEAFLAAHRGALARTVDLILKVTPRGAQFRAATASSGAPKEP